MAKAIKQKYVILVNDNYQSGHDDWQTDYYMGGTREYNSPSEAMEFITKLVSEDVEHYSSYGFKIVAVSNQVITVKTNTDFTLEVVNEGE